MSEKREYNGEPNTSYVTPKQQGREYGSDGKPRTDYDNPHHGKGRHVHDWENGQRQNSRDLYPLDHLRNPDGSIKE